MNKNIRGKKQLPMDHHSQRLLGPERKHKHREHWSDYLEDLEDRAESLGKKFLTPPEQE